MRPNEASLNLGKCITTQVIVLLIERTKARVLNQLAECVHRVKSTITLEYGTLGFKCGDSGPKDCSVLRSPKKLQSLEGHQGKFAAGVPEELLKSAVEDLIIQQRRDVNGADGLRQGPDDCDLIREIGQDLMKHMSVNGRHKLVVCEG